MFLALPIWQNMLWVFPKIGVVNPSKWMVQIMENPIKMDDLGVFPYFWKRPYLSTNLETTRNFMPQWVKNIPPFCREIQPISTSPRAQDDDATRSTSVAWARQVKWFAIQWPSVVFSTNISTPIITSSLYLLLLYILYIYKYIVIILIIYHHITSK